MVTIHPHSRVCGSRPQLLIARCSCLRLMDTQQFLLQPIAWSWLGLIFLPINRQCSHQHIKTVFPHAFFFSNICDIPFKINPKTNLFCRFHDTMANGDRPRSSLQYQTSNRRNKVNFGFCGPLEHRLYCDQSFDLVCSVLSIYSDHMYLLSHNLA